jgi:hypothetical protein
VQVPSGIERWLSQHGDPNVRNGRNLAWGKGCNSLDVTAKTLQYSARKAPREALDRPTSRESDFAVEKLFVLRLEIPARRAAIFANVLDVVSLENRDHRLGGDAPV